MTTRKRPDTASGSAVRRAIGAAVERMMREAFPMAQLLHAELSERIIGTFFHVYNALGYGFLESVYRNALRIEFRARGLAYTAEVPMDVWYRDQVIGRFRADFLVERLILVEVKSTPTINPRDWRQLRNYLRATRLELGLLLHFGQRPRFERVLATW